MKVRKRNHALSLFSAHADRGVQHRKRNTHVRRMSRDTLFARAEYGMGAIEALKRGAPTPGYTLITLSKTEIHEVRAARPLQEVSAVSGKIPELRGCPRQNRLRHQGIMPPHQGIIGCVGVTGQ